MSYFVSNYSETIIFTLAMSRCERNADIDITGSRGLEIRQKQITLYASLYNRIIPFHFYLAIRSLIYYNESSKCIDPFAPPKYHAFISYK